MTTGHFIAGKDVPAGVHELARHDPADERRVVGRYFAASEAEVDAAVAAARAAAPAWRRLTGPARAEILHRAATLLEAQVAEAAAEITAEEGKTLAEARGEVLRAVTTFRHAAEQARAAHGEIGEAEESGTLIATRRRPLGVVGLITPWNFPLAIPVRKGAPALAFGNTVVLKPSSLTPGPALRLARVLHAAGLPPGCWNVLVGEGDIGRRLVGDERIAGISFTGSTAVGRAIGRALAARGASFQGEMGGHSPAVVLADADPARVAEVVAKGAFVSAGQTCTATRRLIVVDAVYDEVVAAVVEATTGLRVGPGCDTTTQICPLVGMPQRDAVAGAIRHACSEGAELLCGGEQPGGDLTHGAFLTPALLGGVTTEMSIATQEVFGPVCAVMRAASAEDAIRLANAGPYGLSAALLTRDIAQAMRFVGEIDAGMVHINRETVGSDPHMPFGGIKDSSTGPREQGRAIRDFFTHEQTVYVHP